MPWWKACWGPLIANCCACKASTSRWPCSAGWAWANRACSMPCSAMTPLPPMWPMAAPATNRPSRGTKPLRGCNGSNWSTPQVSTRLPPPAGPAWRAGWPSAPTWCCSCSMATSPASSSRPSKRSWPAASPCCWCSTAAIAGPLASRPPWSPASAGDCRKRPATWSWWPLLRPPGGPAFWPTAGCAAASKRRALAPCGRPWWRYWRSTVNCSWPSMPCALPIASTTSCSAGA